MQTIVSPTANSGKLTPIAFRVKGRESDPDRKPINTKVLNERGEIVTVYNEEIEVEKPLFLFVDEIWKESDVRDESSKLRPYVYFINTLPYNMMKFIFKSTLSLFRDFENFEESQNGPPYYRWNLKKEPTTAKLQFLKRMERDLERMKDGDPVKEAFEKNFLLRNLAFAIFDLTGPIMQCRNYDTTGSLFGMAIGTISTIILECATALRKNTTLKTENNRKIEIDRYGNGASMDLDNVFEDYMTSGGYFDPSKPDTRMYQLNHKIFYDNKHNVLIAQAFDSKMPGDVPIPRPTVSIRPDWGIKYGGALLLTGEAKSTADKLTGMGPTALAASQQLSYSDTGLFLYMNNFKIRMVEMRARDRQEDSDKCTPLMETVVFESAGILQLGPRKTKLGDDCDNKRLLPKFETNETQAETRHYPQRGRFKQVNSLHFEPAIVTAWGELHCELRVILSAVFETANIMIQSLLEKGDLDEIHARYVRAYNDGKVVHPRYTQEPTYVRRKIIMQDMWKYSEQSMRAWSEYFEHDEEGSVAGKSAIRVAMENAYGNPLDTGADYLARAQAETKLMSENARLRTDITQKQGDVLSRHQELRGFYEPYRFPQHDGFV